MQFLNIGPMEMMLILVLALIVFGPGKLPEIGRAVGKSIGEFRRATGDLSKEFSDSIAEVRQPFDDIKAAMNGTLAENAEKAASGENLTCPQCEAENPAGNKFCRECGARLLPEDATITCPSCQADNPSTNKFCRECGAMLPQPEPAVEDEPAPAESTEPGAQAEQPAADDAAPDDTDEAQPTPAIAGEEEQDGAGQDEITSAVSHPLIEHDAQEPVEIGDSLPSLTSVDEDNQLSSADSPAPYQPAVSDASENESPADEPDHQDVQGEAALPDPTEESTVPEQPPINTTLGEEPAAKPEQTVTEPEPSQVDAVNPEVAKELSPAEEASQPGEEAKA